LSVLEGEREKMLIICGVANRRAEAMTVPSTCRDSEHERTILPSQERPLYSRHVSSNEQGDHSRVFDWLGVDKQGTSYHLHPLNLSWSVDGVDHDLNVYKAVADRLAADTTYWASIIREPNWRHTLVGCVCLLVTRRPAFFEDLCFRFEAGSFVVPQLAVTLGLLNPERATPFFRQVLSTAELRRHPSKAVSADRALLKLGTREQSEVATEQWKDFERDDAKVAERVVEHHWRFWSERL
jgi:aromatic ring-cleaving dioxygenase